MQDLQYVSRHQDIFVHFQANGIAVTELNPLCINASQPAGEFDMRKWQAMPPAVVRLKHRATWDRELGLKSKELLEQGTKGWEPTPDEDKWQGIGALDLRQKNSRPEVAIY